jgi:hypothetical protein
METKKDVIVEFWKKSVAPDQPLLKGLSFNGLTVNLRRARVTPSDAWLQLELSGPSSAIDAFVRRRPDEFMVVTPVAPKVA